jgi:hypothetical protein
LIEEAPPKPPEEPLAAGIFTEKGWGGASDAGGGTLRRKSIKLSSSRFGFGVSRSSSSSSSSRSSSISIAYGSGTRLCFRTGNGPFDAPTGGGLLVGTGPLAWTVVRLVDSRRPVREPVDLVAIEPSCVLATVLAGSRESRSSESIVSRKGATVRGMRRAPGVGGPSRMKSIKSAESSLGMAAGRACGRGPLLRGGFETPLAGLVNFLDNSAASENRRKRDVFALPF